MAHRTPSLVATLGPASWDLAPALHAAGAATFRLNASHLDAVALDAALSRLRRTLPGVDVVVDLQGAKMRLGPLHPREVAAGDRIVFTLDGGSGVPIPHAELFEQTRPGETLSIDDGRLQLKVEACQATRLEAMALNDGRLLPRKGVNVVQHPVALSQLTAADREAIDTARRHAVGTFAFSFMVDGGEADWVRAAAPGCRVVGKIERREACLALEAIARRVDAAWICRGDLGAQLGAVGLARFVASVAPAALPVPVLMAGQVLEHLTRHPEPTRSEVCHLHDLVARGYSGLVLSDETAVGDDPVNAARLAVSLLHDFQSLNTAG